MLRPAPLLLSLALAACAHRPALAPRDCAAVHRACLAERDCCAEGSAARARRCEDAARACALGNGLLRSCRTRGLAEHDCALLVGSCWDAPVPRTTVDDSRY